MAARTSVPYFAPRSWIRNLGAAPKRKRLPQLLDDPAGRILRDVEMRDTPAIVADDKEAVEDAEGDRGHGGEVHGRNRVAMIAKKGQPTPGKFGISGCPRHPARDGSLRNLESQH
jgi:hypothetical protein